MADSYDREVGQVIAEDEQLREYIKNTFYAPNGASTATDRVFPPNVERDVGLRTVIR